MKTNIFLALRYLSGKKDRHLFSFFSIMSIIGIILGVTALIAVLSVMNGFQDNTIKKIISLQTFHLSIENIFESIYDYHDILNFIENESIIGVYPIIETPVLFNIKGHGNTKASVLRGYEDGYFNSVLFKENALITSGSLQSFIADDGSLSLIAGDEFSKINGVMVNGNVIVNAFTNSTLLPRLKSFSIAGLFKTGYWLIDSNVLYTTLSDAQELLNLKNKCTSIGIILNDIDKVYKVKRELRNKLPFGYEVRAWFDFNKSIYAALKNEKVMMFFIVFMIILVAAFNMVSSQTMIIVNKQKEIGILKAIGFTPYDIHQIFVLNGTILGVTGTMLGTILGFIVTKNLDAVFFGIEVLVNAFIKFLYFFIKLVNPEIYRPLFQIFSRDIYYFDKIPVKISLGEVILINTLSILIIFLSTLIAANKAAKVKPKEVIHNE